MGYKLSDDELKMCNRTEALLNRRKKYFSLMKYDKPSDLAELIYNLYQHKRPTYFDEGGEIHCGYGHLRSTQDLYHLCKKYIRYIPYRELFRISRDMVRCEGIFGSHFCSTVLREVYFPRRLNMELSSIQQYLNKLGMNYKAKR